MENEFRFRGLEREKPRQRRADVETVSAVGVRDPARSMGRDTFDDDRQFASPAGNRHTGGNGSDQTGCIQHGNEDQTRGDRIGEQTEQADVGTILTGWENTRIGVGISGQSHGGYFQPVSSLRKAAMIAGGWLVLQAVLLYLAVHFLE